MSVLSSLEVNDPDFHSFVDGDELSRSGVHHICRRDDEQALLQARCRGNERVASVAGFSRQQTFQLQIEQNAIAHA